ncbi:unnamed protein product, partial [Discosporangium mesarthrocarpum]
GEQWHLFSTTSRTSGPGASPLRPPRTSEIPLKTPTNKSSSDLLSGLRYPSPPYLSYAVHVFYLGAWIAENVPQQLSLEFGEICVRWRSRCPKPAPATPHIPETKCSDLGERQLKLLDHIFMIVITNPLPAYDVLTFAAFFVEQVCPGLQ